MVANVQPDVEPCAAPLSQITLSQCNQHGDNRERNGGLQGAAPGRESQKFPERATKGHPSKLLMERLLVDVEQKATDFLQRLTQSCTWCLLQHLMWGRGWGSVFLIGLILVSACNQWPSIKLHEKQNRGFAVGGKRACRHGAPRHE